MNAGDLTAFVADRPAVAGRPVSGVFVLRMAILLLSLLAVALYTMNRIVQPSSLRGVVSAPLMTLRAPIDGQVAQGAAVVGQHIAAGAAMFVVRDPRVDRHRELELRTRAGAAREKLAALDQTMTEFQSMMTELRRRTGEYAAAETARLLATVQGQQVALDSASRTVDFATDRENILRQRVATGTAVEQRLEEAVRARLAARLAHDQTATELQANTAALDAARRRIFVQNGFGGAAYTQQKADDIEIRLAELRYQRAVAGADASGLAAELSAETARVLSIQEVAITAASGGIVTAVHAAAGADVTRGAALAEVMDCGALFVEASIATGWFATPRAGDPVRVTLYGATAPVNGRIRLVRDPAMVLDPSAAPVTVPDGQHTLTVLIDLTEPLALPQTSREGCPIGQPASVRFR